MIKARTTKEGIESICDVIKHCAEYSGWKEYKLTLYVKDGFANLYRTKDKILDKKRKMKHTKDYKS